MLNNKTILICSWVLIGESNPATLRINRHYSSNKFLRSNGSYFIGLSDVILTNRSGFQLLQTQFRNGTISGPHVNLFAQNCFGDITPAGGPKQLARFGRICTSRSKSRLFDIRRVVQFKWQDCPTM